MNDRSTATGFAFARSRGDAGDKWFLDYFTWRQKSASKGIPVSISHDARASRSASYKTGTLQVYFQSRHSCSA